MEKFYLTLIVFCVITSQAYSFMCYECDGKNNDEDYTTEQCEKDQKKISCTGANYTCFRVHEEGNDGVVTEWRGRGPKRQCERTKKMCEDDDMKKDEKVKDCLAVCCVSDGDTPCNSGFAVSADMIMMMSAVLCCSLKLF